MEPSVLQIPVHDGRVPREIRSKFGVKVYSIMMAMLAVSFSLALPFTLYTEAALSFMMRYPWVLAACCAILLLNQIVNYAMLFEVCFRSDRIKRRYLKMMMSAPQNYVFLGTYAACLGVIVGLISSIYTVHSVAHVFSLTAVIFLSLTVYAVTTKSDFTDGTPYLIVAVNGFLLLAAVSIFARHELYEKIAAVVGAVMISIETVYDTQLIFGTARRLGKYGEPAVQRVEFTVDMYAFAAYQLYLDFIVMFLRLLRQIGVERKAESKRESRRT
eukprot:TRINITY_DN57418_c0_g1_i1.p1 TRINITY_DN57418_c0_g1~~TRINITY_DN57418_c0_g1_i1.p1  ORF type:complete len:272 (-),score=27.08 TRINITY_DN57418_c0_g1_i1:203-1018(-)